MEFAIQQLLLFVCLGPFAVQSTDLYSITVKDLQGNVVPMSIFKGKVGIICVNSLCVTRISHVVLSTTLIFMFHYSCYHHHKEIHIISLICLRNKCKNIPDSKPKSSK